MWPGGWQRTNNVSLVNQLTRTENRKPQMDMNWSTVWPNLTWHALQHDRQLSWASPGWWGQFTNRSIGGCPLRKTASNTRTVKMPLNFSHHSMAEYNKYKRVLKYVIRLFLLCGRSIWVRNKNASFSSHPASCFLISKY
jgi:hypothetical protein